MKILIDMNLSPIWRKTLEKAGIDSVHWSELGPAATPDPAIIAFATANGLTILTNDLDFGAALATANRDKPSVVQIRGNDLRPTSIGRQVCQASQADERRVGDGSTPHHRAQTHTAPASAAAKSPIRVTFSQRQRTGLTATS
jgi:predicted nuclease of predicted toxin-antitoxin system